MREALYFRNISFSVKLDSEADVSKYGQIRPHIRWSYPTGAGYENMAGFRPGTDMISRATLEFVFSFSVFFVVLIMGDASDCLQNSASVSSCMVCANHGRQSKLQLCRLNSEEAVYICCLPEVSFTVKLLHSVCMTRYYISDTCVCSTYRCKLVLLLFCSMMVTLLF